MVDLNYIVENEAKIAVLATRFGFSNEVRIARGVWHPLIKTTTLHLVVQELPDMSDARLSSKLLTAKLSEALSCKVEVLVLPQFPQNSAPLSDEEAICQLFGVHSLDQVTLKVWGEKFPVYYLAQANLYLEENALRVEAGESAKKKLRPDMGSE